MKTIIINGKLASILITAFERHSKAKLKNYFDINKFESIFSLNVIIKAALISDHKRHSMKSRSTKERPCSHNALDSVNIYPKIQHLNISFSYKAFFFTDINLRHGPSFFLFLSSRAD